MAVGEVYVQVLELRGRGQHVVRPVGGIGLEVFEHHREQVLARQALANGREVGRDGRFRAD
jgi:hypothetical protein